MGVVKGVRGSEEVERVWADFDRLKWDRNVEVVDEGGKVKVTRRGGGVKKGRGMVGEAEGVGVSTLVSDG